MSGTRSGGMKTAQTNKRLHGDDFYKRIGAKGGQMGRTGGFFGNRELARIAGAKGGKISKRGPAKPYATTSPSSSADTPAPFFSTSSMTEADKEFGEGFFEPTWRQKMLNKIRSM